MNRQEQVDSPSLTIKLLRTIGSPFALEQKQASPENKKEALELYEYATKNKIGLLYLEALKDHGKLEEFGLESKYRDECEKHNKQLITLIRIAKFLNFLNLDYAVFKSIMPYQATPNDIDILCFCLDEEYKELVEASFQNGYEKPEGGSGPFVVMIHDMRNGPHLNPHEKDVYDIDLYKEVSISHIIYLDKRKLVKHVTEMNMLNEKVKALKPEAELVASIIHSIIPEQLFTLFVYYATLYHLLKMNSEEINRFIDVAKENNVTFPVKTHCSLVAELHKAAHGFVPEELEEILANLGNETQDVRNLIRDNHEMPYRYRWAVIRALVEKTRERKFRRSAVVQAMNMLNPKFAKYVIGELVKRRRRETY